ncbi:tumor protein D53 isoform X1 [Erpetoichthys calabaricus]|uniref:tumor protein D53 isoform X1 n=1 Tax=Erpetoichthys calabaricus TaxID=27687 RepID=UPI002233FFF0|nr:tumor protein D53 isoform X1 [Erpetoichthys calabaricus]
MEAKQQGLLETRPLQEVDEDAVLDIDLGNTVSEEERELMEMELAKLEEEILTLKQVLTAKEKHHAELKVKLGISPLSEFKQNFNKSWHDMQTSTAYKKTQETISNAGQMASMAFSNVGSAISRKIGDMSYNLRHSMSMPTMRSSTSFKSFEEKVENTVSTLKSKVGASSNSGGSFEDVLSSTANASSQDLPGCPNPAAGSEPQC